MSPTILDTIIASVREKLPSRIRNVPVRILEEKPFFSRVPCAFAAPLRSDRLSIIAEIKRASPSAGMIRNDFDVAQLAMSYAAHGADALSIVTEPTFFQGDIRFMEDVRARVNLPLLRKDFVIDPYQLVEARAYGADAVLLIATVLDAPLLADLQDAAAELGLSVLVEVHHERELERIDFDRTPILGVNNRDLSTFQIDINRASTVFERVPNSVIRVAESGMQSGRDLAALRQKGIDAVLIGEAFMRAADPGAALTEMRINAESILKSES